MKKIILTTFSILLFFISIGEVNAKKTYCEYTISNVKEETFKLTLDGDNKTATFSANGDTYDPGCWDDNEKVQKENYIKTNFNTLSFITLYEETRTCGMDGTEKPVYRGTGYDECPKLTAESVIINSTTGYYIFFEDEYDEYDHSGTKSIDIFGSEKIDEIDEAQRGYYMCQEDAAYGTSQELVITRNGNNLSTEKIFGRDNDFSGVTVSETWSPVLFQYKTTDKIYYYDYYPDKSEYELKTCLNVSYTDYINNNYPSSEEYENQKNLFKEIFHNNKKIIVKGDIFTPGVISIITWILTIIKYAGILLLIVFGILDFIGATASGSEDIVKKNRTKFIKRLIACVALFLMPYVVNLLLSLANYTMGSTYKTTDTNQTK